VSTSKPRLNARELEQRRLPRSFYLRPTLRVAEELLGCLLVRKVGRAILAGRIVEVEAYLGERDPASHAFRGMTPRNEVMFREGGHLYVYFTYGMHYCANVVTGSEGVARAVLLRALEPVSGIDTMMKRRAGRKGEPVMKHLTNGPARLCQAMGIGRSENGRDLCTGSIFVARPFPARPSFRIARTGRIGISTGTEFRWRFFIRGNAWVSR
jgi:DNA-3-methyladenine glycosylase